MNTKDFSIQKEIQERVNLEDLYYWGQEPSQELPISRPEKVDFKRKTGFWNLMRQLKP